jgi:HK97 gp10 family phage protein
MIELTLTGASELQDRLGAFGPRLQNSLQQAMERITLEAQIGVQAKLEGPVLKHRTGNLVRNITRDVQSSSDGVSGTVGIGRNAWYGKLHEEGFIGTGARKHLLHPPHLVTRKNGERVLTGSPYGIHIPARPFLVPTLRDMEDRIRQHLLDAIQEALTT